MSSSSPPSYSSKDPAFHSDRRSITSKHKSRRSHSSKTDDERQKEPSRSSSISGSKVVDSVDATPKAHAHRRSAYGPEFLEKFAGESGEGRFKVITGSEAEDFYRDFLKNNGPGLARTNTPNSERDRSGTSKKGVPPPVVFAFTAYEAGRKVVDYYMTWKGKTRARSLKGEERKPEFLDSEFQRVTKTLDNEFKRLSITGPPLTTKSSPKTPARPLETVAEATTSALPVVAADPPTPVEAEPLKPPPPISPSMYRQSLTAASVISLPFLNMIRGVPSGNKLPLVVTNPDSVSLSSTTTPRGSVIQTDEKGTAAKLSSIRESDAQEADDKSGDATVKRPSTRRQILSSPWSKLSLKLPKDSAPASVPSVTRVPSAASDISDTSVSSRSSSPKMLIVLLDEKSDHTWHGLEKDDIPGALSDLDASPSSDRHSPWLGPLVARDSIRYRSPARRSRRTTPSPNHSSDDSSSDTSSSDDEGWQNAPVVPLTTHLANAGLLASPDGGSVYSLARAGSTHYGAPTPVPTMYSPYAGSQNLNLNMPYPSVSAHNTPYSSTQSIPYIPAPSVHNTPYTSSSAYPLPNTSYGSAQGSPYASAPNIQYPPTQYTAHTGSRAGTPAYSQGQYSPYPINVNVNANTNTYSYPGQLPLY